MRCYVAGVHSRGHCTVRCSVSSLTKKEHTMSNDVRSQILKVVKPLLELADEYEISDDQFDDRWEDLFSRTVHDIARRTGLHKREIDHLFFDYIEMRNYTDGPWCPEGC